MNDTRNLRDCMTRAAHANSRQSQLAWLEHAEHNARRMAAAEDRPHARGQLERTATKLSELRTGQLVGPELAAELTLLGRELSY